MKKTIWRPLLLGLAFGALSFFSSAVGFFIHTGIAGAIGPHEIFMTLSAALGGPLGLFVASVIHTVGAHIYLMKAPPELAVPALHNSMGDFVARTLALLAVAYCYKYLHQRAQKVVTFIFGWILIIGIYYALLLPLQALDWALTLPGYLSLSTIVQSAPPEIFSVAIITTLIWIALPVRSRKPLWYEPKQASNQSGKLQDK
jgi:hypothetical protein